MSCVTKGGNDIRDFSSRASIDGHVSSARFSFLDPCCVDGYGVTTSWSYKCLGCNYFLVVFFALSVPERVLRRGVWPDQYIIRPLGNARVREFNLDHAFSETQLFWSDVRTSRHLSCCTITLGETPFQRNCAPSIGMCLLTSRDASRNLRTVSTTHLFQQMGVCGTKRERTSSRSCGTCLPRDRPHSRPASGIQAQVQGAAVIALLQQVLYGPALRRSDTRRLRGAVEDGNSAAIEPGNWRHARRRAG
jgi:hypothetical protein